MNIPAIATAIVFLALIVFGRSYKHRLELFRGDWIIGSIRLWYGVGLLLAAVSQYFLLNSHATPEVIVAIDGIALYLAYIQICRD